MGHPSKFQRVSRLGSVTARHSSSRRQLNFAAWRRGHHLYSAGRPSPWALAHILVVQEVVGCCGIFRTYPYYTAVQFVIRFVADLLYNFRLVVELRILSQRLLCNKSTTNRTSGVRPLLRVVIVQYCSQPGYYSDLTNINRHLI